MRVILVRHGDADADVPEGLDDDARPLTARARQLLPGHFAALVPHLGTVNLMLMSPLVRAAQTATILSHALAYEGPLKVHRCLLPDGPVGAIESVLNAHPGQTVVLVGHQPSMSSAAAHFLGMASFPRPFAPGTAVGIERPDGSTGGGRVVFYAPPGQGVQGGL